MGERITFAAVRYKGKIYTGVRHLDIVTRIFSENNQRWPRRRTEGFLTDANRFVGRKEAAKIAFKAGQVRTELSILYSEDIY